MNTLLLKLILTPSLIAAASLAGRKWGHAISGWLIALPLTTGPITLLLALTHGTAFAANTAAGTLTGGFSLASFLWVYVQLARRWSWLPTLAASTLAFAISTAVFQGITLPLLPLFVAVLVAFWIVLRALPGGSGTEPMTEALPGRWDIPLRMVIATGYVLLITGTASALGPHLTGLLAPFPIFTATLGAFAHRLYGPAAVMSVLRGLVLGLFSYASFFFTLSILLEPAGILAAFASAIVVVCVFQGAALWLLQRRTG